VLYISVVNVEELAALVVDLRQEGSDTAEVEVKRAARDFPENVLPTVSAFANTPGGGTIIFGLDESAGFAAVGVYDPAACKATLATKARQALRPPVTFDVWDLQFEHTPILVVKIHEQPAHGKPCRVISSGKAYLRAYDGDYELSQVEEQAFVANRSTPVFDQQPVPATATTDLHPDLLTAYLASCRASSTALAALPDDEILYRTGVTTGTDRELSLAGLLALGIYPQQHVPNCVIQASVAPRAGDPTGTRAADARRFDGPIPLMLDEALRWVQRNTRTRVRFGIDGQARDEPEFPLEAVRELLSNALIHRDLGPYALTQAITLRLDERQLILSNPGGLWGITVDRLGKTGVTSARNGHLLRICQNVRSKEGNRVVEALASGIPAVLASCHPDSTTRASASPSPSPTTPSWPPTTWNGSPRYPPPRPSATGNGTRSSPCDTAIPGPTRPSARPSPWTHATPAPSSPGSSTPASPRPKASAADGCTGSQTRCQARSRKPYRPPLRRRSPGPSPQALRRRLRARTSVPPSVPPAATGRPSRISCKRGERQRPNS